MNSEETPKSRSFKDVVLVLWRRLKSLLIIHDDTDIEATIASIRRSVEFRGINIWILFFAIIIGCVAGAIIEGIKIAVTKKRGKFAFGPYLSVAIFICLLYGGQMYEWYIGLMGV